MAPTMDDVSRHPKMYFQYPPFFRESWERGVREKLQIHFSKTVERFHQTLPRRRESRRRETNIEIYSDVAEKVARRPVLKNITFASHSVLARFVPQGSIDNV